MTAYLNQTLRGHVIALDGNTFERCIFEECTLVYSGGPPPILNDNELRNSRFKFEGQAASTVALLQAMAKPGSGLQHVVQSTFPTLTKRASSLRQASAHFGERPGSHSRH